MQPRPAAAPPGVAKGPHERLEARSGLAGEREPWAAPAAPALRLDRHRGKPRDLRRFDLRALAHGRGDERRRGQGRLHGRDRAAARDRRRPDRGELPSPDLLRRARVAPARASRPVPHDGACLVHELRGELHARLPVAHRRDGALLGLCPEGRPAGARREPDRHRRADLLARHGRGARLELHPRGGPARGPGLHQHQDQPVDRRRRRRDRRRLSRLGVAQAPGGHDPGLAARAAGASPVSSRRS